MVSCSTDLRKVGEPVSIIHRIVHAATQAGEVEIVGFGPVWRGVRVPAPVAGIALGSAHYRTRTKDACREHYR